MKHIDPYSDPAPLDYAVPPRRVSTALPLSLSWALLFLTPSVYAAIFVPTVASSLRLSIAAASGLVLMATLASIIGLVLARCATRHRRRSVSAQIATSMHTLAIVANVLALGFGS